MILFDTSKMISFIIFFIVQFASFECQFGGDLPGKMYPPPDEIIRSHGYPAETHEVTTPDGYILTIYRIPHGKNCTADENKGVVFLQHGLLASSADWVILGPKQGFGYYLADAGYDVWIPSSRGTDYSQKHTTLTATNDTPSEYWNFEFHEMGLYDLPTILNYILEKTGVKKVFYVGHSQGTSQALVASIFHQDLKEKIIAFFFLAPIAFLKHSTNPFLQAISKAQPVLRELPLYMKFAGSEGALGLLNVATCNLGTLCTNIVYYEGGYDATQITPENEKNITHWAPADASLKQVLKYLPYFNKDTFSEYDYGPAENLERYGSIEPPEYQLKKVNIPVYAYIGESDTLTQKEDRERLFSEISHVLRKVTIINHPPWDHNDFLYAKGARSLCYSKVVDDFPDALALEDPSASDYTSS